MIIVLKPGVTDADVEHVVERVKALGFETMVSRGVQRTIVGVIGEEDKLREALQAIAGVEQVVPILKPFKLASREFHAEDSVIEVKGIKVGGGHLAMIAGPCAVEGEAMFMEVAERVREGAAPTSSAAGRSSRGPARTASRGWARTGSRCSAPPVTGSAWPWCTEVMDTRGVEMVARYTDLMQVGARNMQNYDLLKEVGRTRTPVLLKRGLTRDGQGAPDVGRVHVVAGQSPGDPLRARACGPSRTRPATRSTCRSCRRRGHAKPSADNRRPLPRAGRPDLIPAMARAAMAAGADGVTWRSTPAPRRRFPTARRASSPRVRAAHGRAQATRRDVGRTIELREG